MYKLTSLLVALVLSNAAFSADKDFIWSEFSNNGSSKILYSALDAGAWSAPEVIADDGKMNDSPSIAVESSGKQLVVWSYATDEGTAIAYRERDNKDASWSAISRADTAMNKNLTPALIANPNGGFWMFWVGNSEASTDEIYGALYNGQWNNVVNVSEGGNTFNFDPVASINAQGNVELSWVNTNREFVETMKVKQLVNNDWVDANLGVQSFSANVSVDSSASNDEGQELPPAYNEESAGFGSLNDYQDSATTDGNNTIIQPTL